jgi:hypothetical protein
VTNFESYQISYLSPEFDSGDFSCGITQLDSYIKKFALKNQRANIGTTRVLHVKDQCKILGYYTICASKVEQVDIPSIYLQTLPKYPIPCILIGKLALDKSLQKLGLGGYLLFDALQRAILVSKTLGCFAVIVDTYDPGVIPFYTKYGFIPLIDKPASLFLPISGIPN